MAAVQCENCPSLFALQPEWVLVARVPAHQAFPLAGQPLGTDQELPALRSAGPHGPQCHRVPAASERGTAAWRSSNWGPLEFSFISYTNPKLTVQCVCFPSAWGSSKSQCGSEELSPWRPLEDSASPRTLGPCGRRDKPMLPGLSLTALLVHVSGEDGQAPMSSLEALPAQEKNIFSSLSH